MGLYLRKLRAMKRVFLFFIILIIQGSLVSKPLNISVAAKAAILINADNGKVLFSKNADERHFPASTTKIATCLMILNNKSNLEEEVYCPLECLIKIPQKIKKEHRYQDPSHQYRLEPDGTTYGIYAGEYLTVKDLLYGMMLPSGNDASNVLAYHYSRGSIPSYMEKITEYLRSIGCANTSFYNPHGLHYPRHMTTASDLALLTREAIKNPEFVNIVKTTNYERPKTNKQPSRIVRNGNKLLAKGAYYYPKAFGVKTGYHSIAGFTFVGAAKDENRTLISVVLHCVNGAEAFKDSINMFDAAFAEKQLTRKLLNQKESVFTTKVKGSRSLLKASLQEDVSINYFPSEEEILKPNLYWHDFKIPIKKGQKVGEIQVKTEEGKIIKIAYLYANSDVDFPLLRRQMKELFSFSNVFVLIGLIGVMLGFKEYRRRAIV